MNLETTKIRKIKNKKFKNKKPDCPSVSEALLDGVLFPRSFDPCNNEIGKLHLGLLRENNVKKLAAPCNHNPAAVYVEKDVNLMDRQIYQEENYLRKKEIGRAHV